MISFGVCEAANLSEFKIHVTPPSSTFTVEKNTYLRKKIPLILKRLEIKEEGRKRLIEKKLKRLQLEKPFIEHNLKAKYSVSIESLKNKKSLLNKLIYYI